MISVADAKRIGISACIDKLGRDFVTAHKDTSTLAYGQDENSVFCFVGVDDRHTPYGKLTLDSETKFPYRASCHVLLDTGSTQFGECVLPHSVHTGKFIK